MDLSKLSIKTIKMVYLAISGVLVVCAIIAALLHQVNVGVVFLVLASIVYLIGAIIVSYVFKMQRSIKYR